MWHRHYIYMPSMLTYFSPFLRTFLVQDLIVFVWLEYHYK